MKDIDLTLKDLVKNVGMPLKKLGEGLGVTPVEILNWHIKPHNKFKITQLQSLASYLGIGFLELMAGTYDIKLVRRRIHEGPTVLPEKYGLNTGSRVRTSAHILEFLKLYYGQKFCDKILLDMNVHPCYFDDLENQISFQFITDLMRKLTSIGFSQVQIQSLARLLPIFIQESPLGHTLSKTETYEELYVKIMENIDRFDKNFVYSTKISSKGVEFEARPSEQLKSAISQGMTTQQDLQNIFFYRQSLLGSFPILNGTQELRTLSQKAIFAEDGVDKYWIKFPKDNKTLHSFKPLVAMSSIQSEA